MWHIYTMKSYSTLKKTEILRHVRTCCCSLSHILLFVISWTASRQASHPILCHPLLLLPSIFPSIRVLSNESVLCIRWPKYWSFSFSLSNEYSGLISFRIDWFDLFAVQGTLRNLFQKPQFKSINSSVLSFLYNPTLTSMHDC